MQLQEWIKNKNNKSVFENIVAKKIRSTHVIEELITWIQAEPNFRLIHTSFTRGPKKAIFDYSKSAYKTTQKNKLYLLDLCLNGSLEEFYDWLHKYPSIKSQCHGIENSPLFKELMITYVRVHTTPINNKTELRSTRR